MDQAISASITDQHSAKSHSKQCSCCKHSRARFAGVQLFYGIFNNQHWSDSRCFLGSQSNFCSALVMVSLSGATLASSEALGGALIQFHV